MGYIRQTEVARIDGAVSQAQLQQFGLNISVLSLDWVAVQFTDFWRSLNPLLS